MSETYIQLQNMGNKITEDFFSESSPKHPSIHIKKQPYNLQLEVDEDEYKEEKEAKKEKEKIEEIPDTKNKPTSENYTALDSNDTELDQIFDICDDDRDILRTYTVYLCGYKMDQTGYLPFLQYMVKKQDNKMVYPSFSFKCASNIPLGSEDVSGQQLYFQNECFKELLQYVSFEDNGSKNPFDTLYKGYYKSERLENTLYVILDVDQCTIKQKLIPATIDELMNKHTVLGVNVDPSVYNPFYEKRGLTQIKRDDGTIIEIPMTVYKCELDGGQLINQTDGEDEDSFSIIDERIQHDVFNNCYLFSTQPLDKPDVARYVLFTANPAYLTIDLIQHEKDTGFKLGSVVPSVISYISNKMDTNEGDKDDKKNEKKENKDVKEEEEEEENIYELIQNIPNPVIYYHETIDNIIRNFWCVKSSSFFTQI